MLHSSRRVDSFQLKSITHVEAPGVEVKVRGMPNKQDGKSGKHKLFMCEGGAMVYQSLSLVRSTAQGGARERRGRGSRGNKPRPSSRRQQKTAAPHSNSGGLQVHYIVLPALLLL